MALSRIWSAFILTAILAALFRFLTIPDYQDIFYWMVVGKADDPTNLTKVDGLIETCKGAVTICLNLIGIMALFMGLMSIAEKRSRFGGEIERRGHAVMLRSITRHRCFLRQRWNNPRQRVERAVHREGSLPVHVLCRWPHANRDERSTPVALRAGGDIRIR